MLPSVISSYTLPIVITYISRVDKISRILPPTPHPCPRNYFYLFIYLFYLQRRCLEMPYSLFFMIEPKRILLVVPINRVTLSHTMYLMIFQKGKYKLSLNWNLGIQKGDLLITRLYRMEGNRIYKMLLNIEMSVSKEWSKKCYKDACISVEMFVRA